jgi:hypothetical protein
MPCRKGSRVGCAELSCLPLNRDGVIEDRSIRGTKRKWAQHKKLMRMDAAVAEGRQRLDTFTKHLGLVMLTQSDCC